MQHCNYLPHFRVLSGRILWSVMTLCCVSLIPTHAIAVPIPGLFNTGISNGTTLVNGDVDPHYTIVSSSLPYGPQAYVVDEAIGFPIVPGVWSLSTSTSKWITPKITSLATRTDAGIFTYRLTFDLTGLNLSSAAITGQWYTDNDGQMLLNGSSTGFTTPEGGFSNASPFTVTSGFVSGINYLDFVVTNSAFGPTGLRVELGGTADVVPEPSTLFLTGLGLLSLFGVFKSGRTVCA